MRSTPIRCAVPTLSPTTAAAKLLFDPQDAIHILP